MTWNTHLTEVAFFWGFGFLLLSALSWHLIRRHDLD